MQLLLSLFILIGVTQRGGSTDSDIVLPSNYDNLGVPNAFEYVTQFKVSVQTSFITSVECMQSSCYYMESGFSMIDSSSDNSATNTKTEVKSGVEGFQNMMSGLQKTDYEKEAQEKIGAVEYMTANFYKKKEVTVQKSETTFSSVTEIQQARSIFTAKRCESAYTSFVNDVTAIQSKYDSGSNNNNQWDSQVKQYYEARKEIETKSGVYTSIRDAFLFGSGISLCEESAKTDQSLLEIYNAKDLSKYFGKNDNDASRLLSQTVTQMYLNYKASLTVIYLKSVINSDCDLAMRITEWEQLNLVRANFEYKSQYIDTLIKTTKKDAESSYAVDSAEYKQIMTALYTSVNKMLLTVVKSTEVTYKRALNFNPDKSTMKTDFNTLKVDTINEYYDAIIWNNNNAGRYDIRVIEKEKCSYPSENECIPQNMYSLVVNKLVFQTFISQVNLVNVRVQSVQKSETTVEYWIQEKISLVEFEFSIIFSKCSASVNKIFIINSATYTYILLQTDKSIQPTEVEQIMDQTSNDVLGKLCVHTLQIIDTSKSVDIFIEQNSQQSSSSVTYKPADFNKGGSGNGGSPPTKSESPPSGGSGSPPPGSSGSPSPGGSGSPSPGGSGSPSPGGSGSPPSRSSTTTSDSKFIYIINGEQVKKSIELYKKSFTTKITSTLTDVQSKPQNEYTKVVVKSLEISQKVFQCTVDYLEGVASDLMEFISQSTTPDSEEYKCALKALYIDTTEKIEILSSSMDISFRRSMSSSLTCNNYVYVNQIVDYNAYVEQLYSYFGVEPKDVYNSENDVDKYMENSAIQFDKIYKKVLTTVQNAPDDAYKTFLVSYLCKTVAGYKQISDCYKEQIVVTLQFINASGDEDGKKALYHEIVQKMNSIIAIYSSILIKCTEYYNESTTSVTLFESEYATVYQTTIVTSYTSTTEIQQNEVVQGSS